MRHEASRAKLKRIVQVICQPLHKHWLDEIETAHVVNVLMTVWHQRETSRTTRPIIIRKIFDAAIAHNLRPKDDPADWVSRLQPIMPKQRRRGTTRGGKQISNMTMLKYLKELTRDDSLTVHGFRTTFRTWAQEETDFEEEIVEHCLHHVRGDDAEKAYKRSEALRKRRLVMQTFADFAMQLPKNNVAPIKAA